jgi:hypothetical protein
VIDEGQCESKTDELEGTAIDGYCRYYSGGCKSKCEKITKELCEDRTDDCLWLLGVLGTPNTCVDKV